MVDVLRQRPADRVLGVVANISFAEIEEICSNIEMFCCLSIYWTLVPQSRV